MGDDFRYNYDFEFDQQYENYMAIMEFINKGGYNAHVSFGTLADYFGEVRRRMKRFKTLNGDFFVYSDIFSEGRPAYWSGYFVTRPFMKRLSRELASSLRTAEILHTLALQLARRAGKRSVPAKAIGTLYERLAVARQNLALFQHHDGITGTSKSFVMHDYGLKLMEGLKYVREIQTAASQYLLQDDKTDYYINGRLGQLDWIETDSLGGGDQFALPQPNILDLLSTAEHKVVVFNPLAQFRQEAVTIRTDTPSVCAFDPEGGALPTQVSPVYNTSRQALDFGLFDVVVAVDLPPVAFFTVTLRYCDRSGDEYQAGKTKVYCLRCPKSASASNPYVLSNLPQGAVQVAKKNFSTRICPWLIVLILI